MTLVKTQYKIPCNKLPMELRTVVNRSLIMKRTLHGSWKIWIIFPRGKKNILLVWLPHSEMKCTSPRDRVAPSIYEQLYK